MTRSDDRTDLRMPGGIYRILAAPTDPATDPVTMEWTLGPRSFSPPLHRHPHQTETYQVLHGSLELRVDGTRSTLQTGQTATVPPGADHTFRNPAGATVVVRNTHAPALGFADFVVAMDHAMRRPWWDPRRLLGMAAAWARQPDTLVATRPHQRLGFLLVGRLLRHSSPATHPTSPPSG